MDSTQYLLCTWLLFVMLSCSVLACYLLTIVVLHRMLKGWADRPYPCLKSIAACFGCALAAGTAGMLVTRHLLSTMVMALVGYNIPLLYSDIERQLRQYRRQHDENM
jgi:hypothetical protein